MVPPTFRFAHLADAHVGAWPRDPAVRRALRESVLRALRTVEERDCEFLLISGDLFDTPVPEPAEVAPVAAALRELVAAGRRVYVIYGSHDYVAHRTSWLDVLAETGLFLRAAPEAVQAEGNRLSLPFLTDEPTGARIAGVSGRAHGLDRAYFAGLDSEAFRAASGFHVFMFHAAVQEYLPAHLREHIHGISRSDLPGGCQYYAGGHIHYTYEGSGPDGGLLVNPGAVFGTKVPELENGASGRTHQGVVIVTVHDGRPTAEFIDTAPRDRLQVFDVDVSGRNPEEARRLVQAAVQAHAAPGALLFPRLHGTLIEGSVGSIGLSRTDPSAEGTESGHVHWDLRDLAPPNPASAEAPMSEAELERAAYRAIAERAPAAVHALFEGTAGERRLAELVRELGWPPEEGQSRVDYERARRQAALRLLGLQLAEPG